MILSRLFSRNRNEAQRATALYSSAVLQARQLLFYEDWSVADTVEGRFDMLVIHAFFILHRLRDQGEEANTIAQAFFDTMFEDMDTNLREMGVGDMGVARRVPKMAEALYGRMEAYEKGLAVMDDDTTLKEALDRNLYRKTIATDDALAAMATYVRKQMTHVASQPLDTLLSGKVEFLAAPTREQA